REGLAAAVVGLLDELRQGALEALEHQMQIDDLVHAYGLSRGDRLRRDPRLDALDLVGGAPGNREDDDESHLALGTRDLEVEAFLLMTEDLDVAALEAAPAHRAVVEASPVADELDDAHRAANITPQDNRSTAALDAGAPLAPDDCRVDSPRRQHHPISSLQFDRP